MLYTVLPYPCYLPDTIKGVQRHIADNPLHCSIPANNPNYKYTSWQSRRPAADVWRPHKMA
jgi:hypothetical protein